VITHNKSNYILKTGN